MRTDLTPDEMEAELGERLRTLRFFRNLEQKTLAELAGVSVRALRDLESGRGSRVKTLVCVLCALGLQDWLNTIAPLTRLVRRHALVRSPGSVPRIRVSVVLLEPAAAASAPGHLARSVPRWDGQMRPVGLRSAPHASGSHAVGCPPVAARKDIPPGQG